MEHNIPSNINPLVQHRDCGGWLAAAPHWSPLRIAVTAETEESARSAFAQAWAQWLELLAD